MTFIKKNIKYFIIAGVGILLMLIGLLSWNLFFEKYKIFNDMEKEFENAAKRYYEFRTQYLPKEGEVKELTLQDLYKAKQIEDLYIPKTRKMCDVNKSRVRVFMNDKKEYVYNTYLKCGKFESKIDYNGPVITLNGDEEIYMALNTNYEELGVKAVKDDKDGNIDPEKVIIDSTDVNTKKIGTYKVTYTVLDSSYNKTVITRKVKVAKNLTEVIKNSASEDGYFKGNVENNYILYSGQLFRIININSDGTIKLISNEAVTNLRVNGSTYENGNVDTWLKEYYLPKLNNSDYLVESNYCVGSINSTTDYGSYCDTSVKAKIGLLNIDDYNKTILDGFSSIASNQTLIANMVGENFITIPYQDNGLLTEVIPPIRPVITLKDNLFVTSGNGTKEKPYKLNDYSYAKANSKINTRIVGEYITYSGILFRIIDIDNSNNVRLIMAEEWKVQPGNNKVTISPSSYSNWSFALKDDESLGYALNNDYLDFIDNKLIVSTEYEIPTNVSGVNYKDYKITKVTAKILLPKSYELFGNENKITSGYPGINVYIDKAEDENTMFVFKNNGQSIIENLRTTVAECTIKAVLTLNGNAKIVSGKGTINNPYNIK